MTRFYQLFHIIVRELACCFSVETGESMINFIPDVSCEQERRQAESVAFPNENRVHCELFVRGNSDAVTFE